MSVTCANNDVTIRVRDLNLQQITSLNQLTNLYGKNKPGDLAQSLVYGDKPKKENIRTRDVQKSETSFQMTTTAVVPPSKLTLLSQQLFNHIPNQLEAHKSQRAFHIRDEKLLLSPDRLRTLPNQNQEKAPEVANRLLEYQTFVSEKRENLKDRVTKEELASCSFQPMIDEKSRQMALKVTNQEVRSADDFHEDQMNYLQRLKEKRQLLKQQYEQEEMNELVNPQLTKKTQKLAQEYASQPLVERLHVRQSKSLVQPEQSCSFKPEISKKSKNIQRKESVQDYLYNDAKHRQETRTTTQTFVQQSQIQPSDKNYSWFVQRFIKEFYYQLSGLKRVQETKDYSKIYEQDFYSILEGLGLGKSEELWNLLNNGFFVLSRNILVVLLAILAVPQHLIDIPLYKPKIEENVQVKSKYQSDENGNLVLSAADCNELHKQFYKLYLNTKQMNGNGIRRQQARSPKPEIRCGSPKISEKTKQLAQVKRTDLNLHDWFAQQEEKKQQNLELLKSQVEQERMKECKSITREVTIDITELAKPVQKQQDRTTVDIEYENQMQHCTFHPTIGQPAPKTYTGPYAAQEIEKQANRMKEARLRQQTLENLKNRGSTTNNTIRRKEKEKTQIVIENQPKPTKVKSRPLFNQPLLFVDVKIDDGKTVRIVIFEGDSSLVLANKFAKENKLDDSMRDKLKELLDQQINSVLFNI